MKTLTGCAKRFETAVATEQYDQASTLLAEFRECLDATPLDSPERIAMLRKAKDLLTANLRLVRAQRAHQKKELTSIHAGRPYTSPRKLPVSTWQIEA